MHKVNIKPLTANRAWQGRRFKTPEYKAYQRALTLMLPRKVAIPDGPLKVVLAFGLSSANADGDNCIKQSQDIIAAKYGFNDKRIMHWEVFKIPVKKGAEFVAFDVLPFASHLVWESLNNNAALPQKRA